MREFNIFGPVNPKLHYHVNRVEVKAAMRQKIEKGRYFTLNAARQTGKTTLFREVVAELEAEGGYFGILLSLGDLRNYTATRFYERLSLAIQIHFLSELEIQAGETRPDEASLRDHGDLSDWLRDTGRCLKRRGVLIIDEFDAISPELAEPLLAVFREMYLNRHKPAFQTWQSIILVGVRNIPALLGGSQSPFNIADQYRVPYFTAAETADLLTQPTAETGQTFASEVIEAIYRETEGQPFLVNRLGQMLTTEIVPNRKEAIALAHFKRALGKLLKENNTHFASITSKALPHRPVLLPILFYNQRRNSFRDPVTQELLMYGVLRVVEDEFGAELARIANPIYRKMLILTFTPPNDVIPLNGSAHHRHVIEGILNMDGLLDAFLQLMTEHGLRLLRSKKTDRPLEIGGQYLLLSYLTAALDTIGGHVTLESVNSAGEMDLLVFYRGTRFIIQTKVWYGLKRFEQGQRQLAGYLAAAGLDKGYIVLFSEQALEEALRQETGAPFEVTVQDKQVRIYPVVIGR